MQNKPLCNEQLVPKLRVCIKPKNVRLELKVGQRYSNLYECKWTINRLYGSRKGHRSGCNYQNHYLMMILGWPDRHYNVTH